MTPATIATITATLTARLQPTAAIVVDRLSQQRMHSKQAYSALSKRRVNSKEKVKTTYKLWSDCCSNNNNNAKKQ